MTELYGRMGDIRRKAQASEAMVQVCSSLTWSVGTVCLCIFPESMPITTSLQAHAQA